MENYREVTQRTHTTITSSSANHPIHQHRDNRPNHKILKDKAFAKLAYENEEDGGLGVLKNTQMRLWDSGSLWAHYNAQTETKKEKEKEKKDKG